MRGANKPMLSIEVLWIEVVRIARFGIVGGLALVLYVAVTSSIVQSGIASPIVATIVGHLAAGLVSYFGHLYFSFAVTPNHQAFLWRFAVVAAAAFAMNIGVSWLFTMIIGLPYLVAVGTVAVLMPIINYFFNRYWVFLPRRFERGLDDRSGVAVH
jgi:putative flippase GtrA